MVPETANPHAVSLGPGRRSGCMGPAGRRRVAYLLPFLAAVSLYAGSLRYDLTFDDLGHMERPGVEETREFDEVWKSPTLFYRPLVTGTFWLETRHNVPLPVRHGVNVALHAVVTLLVVRLVLSLVPVPWIACGAGLLFAVHPVHVEAVAGLVGRADLLVTLWLLLALWVHERATISGRWFPALVPAVLLAFLAANSKETAWGLPALVLVLHLAWRRSPWPHWPLFASYALGIGGHLVLRQRALGAWLASPRGELSPIDNPLVPLTGVERLLGGLKVGGLNLAHLAFPVTLAPDYSGGHIEVITGLQDPWCWVGILLVIGPILVAARALRSPGAGSRALLAGSGWLLISAFMVMNLVYTIETVLADRLLYWPSIAWVLLLAGAVASVPGIPHARSPVVSTTRWKGVLVGGILLFLAAGYTVRAASYIPLWRNNRTLFEGAVGITPKVARAWYCYGFELHYAGELEPAIVAYRKTRQLQPSYQEAWAHEAAALMQLGRWDEAERPLAEALRLDPKDAVSLVNSGAYWLHADSVELAAERFRTATREDSTYQEGWYNLALAEERLGKYDHAESAIRKFLEAEPEDAEALGMLAALLTSKLSRAPEGERAAREALRLSPGTAEFMGILAEALHAQGKRSEAVDAAREALRMEDTPEHRTQLERMLADP